MSRPEAGAPALRCRGVVHVYRVSGVDVAALRGIDLVVPAGQRVALLGPSGSGKSTLLGLAAGIMRPSAGRVEVFGTDLGAAGPAALRRMRGRDLGLMLQGAATNLLLWDDVRGNLAAAVGVRGDASLGNAVLRAGGVSADRRPVGSLSPSEQQVVALAVAMAARPRLLLVDEPTSRLDDDARDRLLDALVRTTEEQGTAVLVVTHDEAVARRMDRTVHLSDGRVAEEGTDTGRYAVIGGDGGLQMPESVRERWPSGTLVSVEQVSPSELRLIRVQGHAGRPPHRDGSDRPDAVEQAPPEDS